MDYAVLRKRMVEDQLIARGIQDQSVLNAFGKVERHRFVPEDLMPSSYGDFPVSIGEAQTISQPYIVALMTERLTLNRQNKVLEIGTGSGYQTAILAELVFEVYSIEKIPSLSQRAKTLLNDLGYSNIKIKEGDGTSGWQEESPFDKIIVTAASSTVPLPLIEQLKDNGRLIIPLGGSFSQVLTLIEKNGNKLWHQKICDCVFVPLVGKFGGRF